MRGEEMNEQQLGVGKESNKLDLNQSYAPQEVVGMARFSGIPLLPVRIRFVG
jgi:hypothetical protein